MAVKGKFPAPNTQLVSATLLSNQTQKSGTVSIADRTIKAPSDGAILKIGALQLNVYPSMQEISSIIAQINAAGILCTVDREGFLTLPGVSMTPTSNDPNVLTWLGFA